jgi:hypothetical protein
MIFLLTCRCSVNISSGAWQSLLLLLACRDLRLRAFTVSAVVGCDPPNCALAVCRGTLEIHGHLSVESSSDLHRDHFTAAVDHEEWEYVWILCHFVDEWG